jgi:hypothetical protein
MPKTKVGKADVENVHGNPNGGTTGNRGDFARSSDSGWFKCHTTGTTGWIPLSEISLSPVNVVGRVRRGYKG